MRPTVRGIVGLAAVAAVGHFVAFKIVHIPAQLELVMLLGAILFYPVVRYPVIGLYATFVLSPFIPFLRRLYYLIYSRPLLDPLIILGDLILALMLIGLFFDFRDEMQREHGTAPYRRMVLIYFGYLALRTVVLNYAPASRALAEFKYYGPPVLMFLVGGLYAGSERDLRRLWAVTAVIALGTAAYGFRQLYMGYIRAEEIWMSSIEFTSLFVQNIPRPFSTFQAPVAFADYMLLGVLSLLMLSAWSRRGKLVLLVPGVAFLFYANLITSVRSSWVGIIVTLLLWTGLSLIRTTRGRIIALAILPLCYASFDLVNELFGSGLGVDSFFRMAASVVPNREYMDLLVTNRASAIYNPLEEHSFLSRLVLWKYIFATSANPLNAIAGRGIGVLKADSLYMTYLAELGYPGLIFVVVLFIVFIRAGLGVMDRSEDRFGTAFGRGMVVLNVVLAVTSIAGSHIHYFPGDVYFWFWNGVLVKRWVKLREQQEPGIS